MYDNIGLAFSILYTGSESYASITIMTDGNGKAIKLQTKIGASKATAIVDLDIDLDKNTFKTTRALARYISSFANYTVTVSNYANYFCSVNDLDAVYDKDIKTSTFIVTQIMADLKNQLSKDSSYVYINLNGNEVNAVDNFDYISLEGGSEGKTPSDWTEYFDMLSKYDIQYVVPLTADDYILSECLEHVNEMSEMFGRERRAVVGIDIGKSVSYACDTARLS